MPKTEAMADQWGLEQPNSREIRHLWYYKHLQEKLQGFAKRHSFLKNLLSPAVDFLRWLNRRSPRETERVC